MFDLYSESYLHTPSRNETFKFKVTISTEELMERLYSTLINKQNKVEHDFNILEDNAPTKIVQQLLFHKH